jgi:hypothetical protein
VINVEAIANEHATAQPDLARRNSMTQQMHPAVKAVAELADERERALDLLDDFCERFYWIKDHPDYQDNVRKFLTANGRSPRAYGH